MRVMGLTAPGLSPVAPQMGDPTTISDSFMGNITGAAVGAGFDRDRSMMNRSE